MKTFLPLILGVCMTLAAAARPAYGAAPETRLARLPNGMTILAAKDSRFPLASIRLLVHAGSAYETDEEAGISHLLEHMVFKGTSSRPGGETARQIEAAGGYLNAFTSFDRTCYLTDMPADQWKLGMDVVRDMAFNPLLDPKDLEMEKEVVIAELKRYKDSPTSNLAESMLAATLNGTPYERPIIGFENTVRAITADHMRAYIRKFYQPQNMLLVVVGNVELESVMDEARRQFGSLENSAEIAVRDAVRVEDLASGPRVSVQPGAWNKVYLGLSFPAPVQRDMRSIDLDVLAYLLTGNGASWLSRKYQYEKQLVDSIHADNQNFAGAGIFSIVATLDADKLPQFWEELVKDLATLKATDFTEEELRCARVNVEDAFQREHESLESMASWMGFLQFEQGGLDAGPNMLTAYRRVTLADVQKALDTWIRPQRLNVQCIYPKSGTAPDLKTALEKSWPSGGAEGRQAAAADEPLETIDLGQGRTLLLIHDTTMPYTSVNMEFTGGNALLPAGREGLAHLTAQTLTDGAGSLSSQEMEVYLCNRATSIATSADQETFSISLRQPSRFNADIFSLLKSILTEPRFAPDDVARGKKQQLAAIVRQNDQPLGLAFSKLGKFLYPGHPYGYASLGTAADVAAYDVQDVKDFWSRQVRQPWVLAVAGDFDRQAVLDFARSLPVPRDEAVSVPVPAWGGEKTLKLALPERNQAHLLLIFKTVPSTHKDLPAFSLLKEVLAGQSGLLFTELRDKQGLGYTVTAFTHMAAQSGYMAFYIGTEPDKLEQARQGFASVIRQLQETPLEASLLKAGCAQMRGSYHRGRQLLSERSSEAATLTILNKPTTFLRDIMAKAEQLEPADLQALAKKYLNMDEAYTVTVLPH